jgi:hypothetical protein
MNRMRTKLAAVLVAGLVLGAGACGGGSKKEESSTGDAIKSSAETTTTTESSSSSGSESTNELTDSLSSLGGAGDCMTAGLAYFALSMQALGASFGMSESDLADMQSSISELKAEIPSAIEADFTTFANALSEYANAMKGMDMSDLMSGSSQAEDAAKILETPEVTQAQANIEAYFDKECPS